MKSFRSKAIILRRVDYGEADRIITFLTPEHGQVSAMAKGVRRPKSRLAGGLELFSESDVMFLVPTRGELYIVRSTRLDVHYDAIISDYARMQCGYGVIQAMHAVTREAADAQLYGLCKRAFTELNDVTNMVALVELWFSLAVLDALGLRPNLETDADGQKLSPVQRYDFNIGRHALAPRQSGEVTADHIKLWRLLLARPPHKLQHITGIEEITLSSKKYIDTLMKQLA